MRKVFLLAYLVCALPLLAQAQFNSGSTGADGALDLSTMTCPNNICEVQLPESGILNYTTVNVPQEKTLRFKFNSRNTPVIILAQGNVNISGRVSVDANGIVAGVGGFYGGTNCQNGFGPGGGVFNTTTSNGRWVGSISLVPIIGGSGGAGGGNCSQQGGGGGGAIVIASSANISLTSGSVLTADGNTLLYYTPGGSGGAIRLVANSMNIAGGVDACGSFVTNCGVIRFEAPQGAINFAGTATPTAIFATINSVIISTNPPTLTIASIGGYAVPSYSAGRPDRVDLLLPTQLADPLNIVIQGSGVPSGTQVQIQLSGASGTATNCTLTGGLGPVSCNASVSGLSRTGVSTLLAVAVFTPPPLAEAFNSKGQNYVVKVKLETALGGKPKYAFLRADGTQIETKNLSPQFLQQFGM